MEHIWSEVTQPQATIIAAFLTIVAAVLGVLLGSWLFGGRVKSLQSALDKTEAEVGRFKERVDEQLKDLEPQIAAVLKIVREIKIEAQDIAPEEVAPTTAERALPTRKNLKAVWHQIRDKIEQIASDQNIDGRTRARYSRYARYTYEYLIEALASDRHLNGFKPLFLEANSIWQNYQRRPNDPTLDEFNRLQAIRDQVLAFHIEPMDN